MRRAIVFIFVFLLLAGMIGGLSYFQFVFKPAMIRSFIAKAARPVQTVAVTTAKSENWTAKITSIGTVHAIQQTSIAPEVAGIVNAIKFHSGEDISKGDVLLTLDDSTEQADLLSNLAALKNADLTLQRSQKLTRTGSVAQSTLDQAEATRDQAAAAVQKSRALIAQKRLTAPFSGRLGIRAVNVGQYLSTGASIVTLQKLDPIYLDFPVPEQQLGALRVGAPVKAAIDSYPDVAFAGKIEAIDAQINAQTRTVQVRALLPNPGKKLLPGMFANITVFSGVSHKVTTLPRTAIDYTLYGDSVFVLKPAPVKAGPGAAQAAQPSQRRFIAERRVVKIGETQNDRVAILSGVAPGEEVVSEGQIKLAPGAIVTVSNSQALPPALTPLPRE